MAVNPLKINYVFTSSALTSGKQIIYTEKEMVVNTHSLLAMCMDTSMKQHQKARVLTFYVQCSKLWLSVKFLSGNTRCNVEMGPLVIWLYAPLSFGSTIITPSQSHSILSILCTCY